jgi:hypothetical protein
VPRRLSRATLAVGACALAAGATVAPAAAAAITSGLRTSPDSVAGVAGAKPVSARSREAVYLAPSPKFSREAVAPVPSAMRSREAVAP